MSEVKKLWDVLCDVNRRDGIVGHNNPHGEGRKCAACENVRAYGDARELKGRFAEHVKTCAACFYGAYGEKALCPNAPKQEES